MDPQQCDEDAKAEARALKQPVPPPRKRTCPQCGGRMTTSYEVIGRAPAFAVQWIGCRTCYQRAMAAGRL